MRRQIFPALALAAMTVLTLPAAADAQTPQPERGRMGQPGAEPAARILQLRQELGLTDAQVAQIGRIQAQLQEQNAPLVRQLTAARTQLRTEREQMTAEQREQIRDQMRARRDSMVEVMRERADQMRERRDAMRDSMRARAEQLTPEQREQMRDTMRAQMQQRARTAQSRMREMRQRPGFAGRSALPEELRPVMEQLRTNNRNAVEQIQATLTEEQKQKLRELRPAPRRPGEPGMRQAPRRPGERGMRQTPRTGRGRVQGAAAGTR